MLPDEQPLAAWAQLLVDAAQAQVLADADAAIAALIDCGLDEDEARQLFVTIAGRTVRDLIDEAAVARPDVDPAQVARVHAACADLLTRCWGAEP